MHRNCCENSTVNVQSCLKIILLLILSCWPVAAQTEEAEQMAEQDQVSSFEPFASDRPLLIRAPVVENGRHQIEIDVKVLRDRDGAPMKSSLPVLYRYDTGPNTEFRVQTDFLTYQNPNLGFSDLSLGFKWNFAPGRSSTSVMAILELPSGSAGFADPGPEPSFILIHDQRLEDRWSLALNVGMNYKQDSQSLDYYWVCNSAAQLSYSLTPTTQLTTAMLVKTPDARFDGITRLSGALGISHFLSDSTRLSLTAARALSATGDDYYFVFGWSTRL